MTDLTPQDINNNIVMSSTGASQPLRIAIAAVAIVNTIILFSLHASQLANKYPQPIYIYIAIGTFTAFVIFVLVYGVDLLNKNRNLSEKLKSLNKSIEKAGTTGIIKNEKESLLALKIDKKTKSLLFQGTRNILLSIDTIQMIIAAALEHGDIAALKELGSQVGVSFATNTLAEHIQKHAKTHHIQEQEKIQIWCDYDQTAGFGLFVDRTIFDKETREYKKYIELRYSFLTAHRYKKDLLCPFMEGYISGVLNIIIKHPDENLEIKIKHTACNLDDILPYEGCKYEISYEEKPEKKLI